MPLGMNPPWLVQWAKPPSNRGHSPRMQTAPTSRNATIAATLMDANQYSTSPQERTDRRLRTVKTSTSASVNIHGTPSGYQNMISRAPATASRATTMTQKYQYIQPVRKPASSPSASRLYS